MARDTEDIYQEMLVAKQADANLNGLDSPSNTAMWQMLLRFLAQIHRWFEQKWDAFKIEIQQVLDDNQFGTFSWWERIIEEFQYEDALAFINNKWQYPTINPIKRIIKFISITDDRGVVNVKVAKINNNRPLNLSTDEAAALTSYLRARRPPGTRLIVESLPADKLKTQLVVRYNAQFGEANIRPLVEAAYINYINTLDFNGIYYVNKMIDTLQAIPAVINEQVEVISISAKQGIGNYVQFTSKFQAKSGYFEVDTDFPLSATITYVGV